MTDIAYEPHPVSPERKAELRAQGFRIIDARYARDGFEPEASEVTAPIPTVADIATMKKGEAKEWLEAHGADTSGTVGELRDRLRTIMYMEAE